MKLIDYCIKLSDTDTLLATAESIASEETGSEGRAMIAVLLHMAIAGFFVRSLSDDDHYAMLREHLFAIDIDVLAVETLVYTGFIAGRLWKNAAGSEGEVDQPNSMFDDLVTRFTIDIVQHYTKFNAIRLLRDRKRVYWEALKQRRDVSDPFARVLYCSASRSSLSDPLDVTTIADSDLEPLGVLKAGIDSHSSVIPSYLRAISRDAAEADGEQTPEAEVDVDSEEAEPRASL